MTQDAAGLAPYQSAFRDAALSTALVTLDGRWLAVNDAFCRLLGHERELLLQREYGSITHEDDRALDAAEMHALLEGQGSSYQVEKRLLHAAGHPIWVQTLVSLGRDDAHNPSFLVVHAQDVAARRRAEAEARVFFDNSLDLLAIAELSPAATPTDDGAPQATPASCRFLRVNPAWQAALGYSAEQLTSRPFLDFVHEEDHETTLAAVADLLAGKQVRAFRNRYRAQDGSLRWLDWNTQPEEGGRLFCVARDVTDQVEHEQLRRRLEDEIRQAALIDTLTGIYNRRGFFLLAEQALRSAARHQRPYLLCFFDLNGLKEINDELGHDQGDEALYDMAEVLRSVFRSSDIIGRLGGDEFVVLAEGDTAAEAALRQRVGDEVVRHNQSAGRAYRLSTSIGVARFESRRPRSLSELLQEADRQMYEHKRYTRKSSAPQTDLESATPKRDTVPAEQAQPEPSEPPGEGDC